MSAAEDALFGSFDREEVDEAAGRLLAVIIAVAEFARPTEEQPGFFEAVTVRALVSALAGLIAHPHTDGEQDAVLLPAVAKLLHEQVADARGCV